MRIGFLSEIAGGLGLTEVGHKCLILGGRAVYAEGHGGILGYKKEEIVLRAGRGKIIIEGRGLLIKRLTKNDILIEGEVSGVREEHG